MSATPVSAGRFKRIPSSPGQAGHEHSEKFVALSSAPRLQNSFYGHFHRYLQHCGLEEHLVQNLQLPRVVVVGGRSAGKASLLESMTKCPIFPRHRDFCIKAPVTVRMQHDPSASEREVTISYYNRPTKHLQAADEILAEVNAIMHDITGIDENPVMIEICQADLPTFEVVDLPGIQVYPAEQEKATTELVSKYLSQPHTLVLCVLDATTSAFDSSIALKLIREAGKLKNTIVAMTKSDLVTQDEEYVPKIFDRILGQSSDNEHLQDLAGCVAVANLPAAANRDSAMVDAAVKERQVFARMLHDPADAFAPPDVQHRLRENMTVECLIMQLDHTFHDYITQHWKPAALSTIANLIAQCAKQLAALGPPTDELTGAGVFNTVMEQVDHAELCDAINLQLQQTRRLMWKPWEQDTPLSMALECACRWGTLNWADNTVSVRRHAQLLLKELCNEHNLLKPLQEHFLHLFRRDPPPMLQRFPALQACIVDQLAPAVAASLVVDIKPQLQRIVESTLADLYLPDRPLSAQIRFRVIHLDKVLAGCIISHFREAMDTEVKAPLLMHLPEGFQLEEAQIVQAKRAKLLAMNDRLQTAHRQISHIEEAFHTSESSSAAVAAAVNSAFGPAPFEFAPQFLSNGAESAVDQQSFAAAASTAKPGKAGTPTINIAAVAGFL